MEFKMPFSRAIENRLALRYAHCGVKLFGFSRAHDEPQAVKFLSRNLIS